MAECDPWCSELGVPEHLHTNQRETDPVFEASENLFRRFEDAEASPPLEAFSTSRMSVNREKYSQGARDVLYSSQTDKHYFDWSVARFTAGDVREGEWRHPQADITYRLDVFHRPEQCMYPHAEVVVTANGEEVERVKPTTVKLRIREFLQERACRAIPS